MGGGTPLVTACIFCLLCATQSHSSSHHDTSNIASSVTTNPSLNPSPLPLHLYRKGKVKRGLDDAFIRSVFMEYGDGDVMTRQGFAKMLESLGIAHESEVIGYNKSTVKTETKNESRVDEECKAIGRMLVGDLVTPDAYFKLCPAIIHQLLPRTNGSPRCRAHHHSDNNVTTNQTAVWVYASLSVILISLCGLLAVAVIPLMHREIYHSLLQYLVAVAVGTLCGDALLHLLPHAMMAGGHSHEGGAGHRHQPENQHDINLWRGLVAALSLTSFYFTEKCLSFIAKWKKTRTQKHKLNTKVRVMRDESAKGDEATSTRVGEKLCKHKYSSYPFCYGEIDRTHGHQQGDGEPEINSIRHIKDDMAIGSKPNHAESEKDDVVEKKLLEKLNETTSSENYTTIILREHHTSHHGHAHTHGHVHSAPGSLGSVAWMVVMGDGIHNFTDGLAIGAAFAANIGGGVSTAVAVFCHELPHELGDFAVLLKAGMSAKQAVFYNMLSSVLCLLGMCIGVLIGRSDTATLWVFSAAAGMFLYIALVDMIPELTSNHSHSERGTLCQCLLQVGGMLTGITIMLLIALFEQDLKETIKKSF